MIIRICIFICSFVCFGLQLNLNSIFAFMHNGDTLVRITPYCFLGCSSGPLLLWAFHRSGNLPKLPWLTPILLGLGAFFVPYFSNQVLSTIFLVLVMSSSYANLLVHLFEDKFVWAYFFDLLGGIFAFVIALFCLPLLSGEGVYLLIFTMSFVPIWLSAQGRRSRFLVSICTISAAVALLFQVNRQTFDMLQILPSRLFHGTHRWYGSSVIKLPTTNYLMTRWSAIARVDVMDWPTEDGRQIVFYYNDQPWTSLTPDHTGRYVFLNSLFRDRSSALAIGIGGGNDLRGLEQAGFKDITGVELNDATVSLMRNEFSRQSDQLYEKFPVVLAEARAYLESISKSFDVILINQATVGNPPFEGNIFLDSHLFSREAFETYFNRLTPDGIVIFIRHLNDDPAKSPDSIRLLHTIHSFLMDKGMSLNEHLLMLSTSIGHNSLSPKRAIFVLSKRAQIPSVLKSMVKPYENSKDVRVISMDDIPTDESEVFKSERVLNTLYHKLEETETSDSTMVTTDAHPYYNLRGRTKTIEEFTHLGRSAPLLICALLALMYFFVPGHYLRKQNRPAEAQAVRPFLLLALLSGSAYGFLLPFFYNHFLIFSRSPLITMGLVQLGALTAAILANFFAPHINRKSATLAFIVAVALLTGIHFHANWLFSSLKLSEISYDVLILLLTVPTVFFLGCIFPRSIQKGSETSEGSKTFLSEAIFGINLAGLGMGAFLSFFTNIVWSLNLSYIVLTLLLISIFALQIISWASSKIDQSRFENPNMQRLKK